MVIWRSASAACFGFWEKDNDLRRELQGFRMMMSKTMKLLMQVIFAFNLCISASDVISSSTPASEDSAVASTLPLFVRRLRSAVTLAEACRHGSLIFQTDAPVHCVCEGPFTGERCQRLNMTMIGQVVLGGTVILHWERPPRLRGFSVVFQEAKNTSGPSSDSHLRRARIVMKDDSRSLVLENLRAGGTPYWVCIEEDHVADFAVSNQLTDQLTNCLCVSTLPDYDSMAGWALALTLSGLTVLLIYLQRDKIELLYFSRPMTGYYEPVQQQQPQQQPQLNRHQSDQDNGSGNHIARNPPNTLAMRI